MQRIQEEHADWQQREFGHVHAYQCLLGIVEELGELDKPVHKVLQEKDYKRSQLNLYLKHLLLHQQALVLLEAAVVVELI